MLLLSRVVEYIRSNGAPFRLVSYPSPESAPGVAVPHRPKGSVMVDTRILLVDGRPAIGVVPQGEGMNLLGLRASIGAELVQEGEIDDLPWPFSDAGAPVPPFGHLFGAPVFIDPSIIDSTDIGFAVFSPNDFIEMPYDDFARLEQPRVADLVAAGELPPPPLH